MTSDNLDILIVGVPDDDNSSSALACPCSHSERLNPTHPGPSRTSPRTSATDNRDHLFPPIPVLRSPQISLDVFGSSSSCVSSSHPPHPSPTHPSTCSSSQSSSIQWAANSILSRDKDEEQDRRRKRGNSSTERNAKYNSSLRPSPLRSAHSDVATSPTPAHVDASSDAGLRPSSVTRFFRRTIRRVRRSSSSPNGATDTLAGSDTTRNDGQKGDHVEVKGKRTRPAPLDLKQEADFGYFQKQTTVLDNLKERLETANKLHEEAVDLETLYESGTVAAGRDFRATGIPRPLPQDDVLFDEVDSVLADIRQFYEELKKFWTEETRHVIEAVKKGRTDPRDFERWKTFHSSLKQALESWKNRPPGDAPPLRSNIITSSSTGADLGAIAASLSSSIGFLGEALERMSSSASLQYSLSGLSYFQRVYVAFAGNSHLCLSLLRHCADYGEKVFSWCSPSIASPTSSRSLKTLEDIGGLGTHSTRDLSTGTERPPSRHAPPDPTQQSLTVSHATDKDPPKPDIMTPPPHAAGESQGLQSTLGLGGGGSGVGLPDTFKSSEGEYRTSTEDRERIFGQDNLPQRPRERFLHLTWPALKDAVLILLSIYATVSLAFSFFQDFGTTRPPRIPG
ncbi:hypothetical protein DFH94DRAFT_850431 [Russula ochroleuca]|uniref:Uncharacterized protein n=1 Tax=Russula ochroleuca TaxID=152965 RepID=A0A9P5TDF7_9AGAM|nr:hypothetical protein DFH94DRAFT_850431 [Russula ochroleuca]